MKDTEKTKNRFIRNDVILISFILIIAAIGLLYLFVFRSHGNMVQITVDGKQYGEYPLSQNITKDIYWGEDNKNHNRLVIKDGKAFMETATCPDGICVAHNAIFRKGESIICLPNRVVISVVTKDDVEGPDIVA